MGLRAIAIGLVSYLAAVFVSAVSVLVLLALSASTITQWDRWSSVLAMDGPLIGIALYLVGVVGLVPFLAAIAILHGLHRTDWLAYTIAGVAVSLVAQLLVWFGSLPSLAEVVESWPVSAGGAVAGFTYWATQTLLNRYLFPVRATG